MNMIAMRFTAVLALSAALAVAVAQPVAAQPTSLGDKKVVCPVYTKSNPIVQKMSFDYEKVDWSLCTHVVIVTESEEDPWESDASMEGDLKQLTDLKQKYSNLKILLGIGRNLKKYSQIVADAKKCGKNVEDFRDFIVKHNLDGLNFQLEDDLDKIQLLNKFVRFVAKIRSVFEKSSLLVAVTLNVPDNVDHKSFEFEKLSKSLDFMNIVHNIERNKGYKLTDATKSLEVANHEAKIKAVLEMGIKRSKIVFGIHLTGPSFALADNATDKDAKFRTVYGYAAVCKAQSNRPEIWGQSYTEAGVPLFRKSGDNALTVVLENSRSIANKVRLAIKNGLGGIAPMLLVHDDFEGKCNTDDTFKDFNPREGITLDIPQRNGDSAPLLRTINEAISVTMDEVKQEAIVYNVPEPVDPVDPVEPTPDTAGNKEATENKENTADAKNSTESAETETKAPQPVETKPPQTPSILNGKKVVCPVYSKSDLDFKKSSFDFEKVDWNLCTHVVILTESDEAPWDSVNVISKSDLKHLTDLRQKNPNLKILMGINRNLKKYSTIVAIQKTFDETMANSRKFIADHNLDGMHLQLFESINDVKLYDDFVTFVRRLNAVLGKSNLSLSLTMNIPDDFNHKEYNLENLSKSLEFLNIVHDYRTGTESYLLDDATKSFEISSDEEKLKALLKTGIPPEKIVFGVHLTGPAFAFDVWMFSDDDLHKTFGYAAVCKAQSARPEIWEKFYTDNGVAVYKKTGDNAMQIVLEDSRSIANKVRLAIKNGLGGIAPMVLVHDDLEGKCIDDNTFDDFNPREGITLDIPQRNGSSVTLLRTIYETIGVTLDELKQEAKLYGAGSTEEIAVSDTGNNGANTENTENAGNTAENTENAENTEKNTENAGNTMENTENTGKTVNTVDNTGNTAENNKNAENTAENTENEANTVIEESTEFIRKVVCPVYTKSDLDLKKITFDIDKVDWSLCTHVVVVADSEQDPWESSNEFLERDLKQLRDLKQKNPDLKILLGVRRTLETYKKIVFDKSNFNQVVEKSRDIIVKYQLDGMNLQVEDGISGTNLFNRFMRFVTALKPVFEKSKLLLAATMNIPENFNHKQFDFKKLSKSLDFMNIVHEYKRKANAYTMDDVSTSLEIANDQEKLAALLDAGVPPSKVIFGVHLAGPAFALVSNGKGLNGKLRGIHGYGSICKAQTNQAEIWEKTYTEDTNTPVVMKLTSTGDIEFIVFLENARTIANKVRLAIKSGLGGIAPMLLVHDDFEGNCIDGDTFDDFITKKEITLEIPQRNGNSVPLLRTINEAINVTLDELKQEESLDKDSESDEEIEAPGAGEKVVLNGKMVVCPIPTQAELGANTFKPKLFNWNLCTHVISADNREDEDAWIFRPDNTYDRLAKLKKTYTHLKINLGVRRTVAEYLEVANDETRQQGIIQRLYTFVVSNKFNGINLQFEDLEESNILPEEFGKIVSFVAALKVKLASKRYLLTVSFAASADLDYKRLDYAALSNSVEFITIVPNYSPSKDGFKLADAKKSLKISHIRDETEKLALIGVEASKVVMGIHFTGFGFNKKPEGTDADATFDKVHLYNEAELNNADEWRKTYSDAALTVRTNTNNDQIVVMQSTRAVANKVRFMVKQGLAGVAPIYVPFDEFDGLNPVESDTFKDFKANGIVFNIKKPIDQKWPLLRTINQAFDLTLEECRQREKREMYGGNDDTNEDSSLEENDEGDTVEPSI